MRIDKIPGDIQLKMGTKDHAFWLMVKKNASIELESHENAVKLQKGMIEHADKRIKEEIAKFK